MAQRVLTAANALTAGRLLLLLYFLWLISQGQVQRAVVVFVVAWALDGLDGWLARHWHQATHFGFIFDKTVDRLLLLLGVVALVRVAVLPPPALLLLTKDLALVPMLTMKQDEQSEMLSLGVWGRVMTLLQGLAVLWLALGGPFPLSVITVVAVVGGVVGGHHLYRVVYE